jgi:hypothetical protein
MSSFQHPCSKCNKEYSINQNILKTFNKNNPFICDECNGIKQPEMEIKKISISSKRSTALRYIRRYSFILGSIIFLFFLAVILPMIITTDNVYPDYAKKAKLVDKMNCLELRPFISHIANMSKPNGTESLLLTHAQDRYQWIIWCK